MPRVQDESVNYATCCPTTWCSRSVLGSPGRSRAWLPVSTPCPLGEAEPFHSILLAARDMQLLSAKLILLSPPQSEMAGFTSNLLSPFQRYTAQTLLVQSGETSERSWGGGQLCKYKDGLRKETFWEITEITPKSLVNKAVLPLEWSTSWPRSL